MTRIISWNINGFRSPSMGIYDSKKKRIKEIENESEKPNILKLIDDYNPDIICLSETKCQDIHEDIFNDFFQNINIILSRFYIIFIFEIKINYKRTNIFYSFKN